MPFAEWDHGMHVRVALNMLQSYGSSDGAQRMVDGLRLYNEAAREEFKRDKKVKVSAASDHATITWFWLCAIRDRLREGDSFETFITRHPELASFSYIFEFYSHEDLYSAEYHDAYIPPPSRRRLRQERGGASRRAGRASKASGKGKSGRRR